MPQPRSTSTTVGSSSKPISRCSSVTNSWRCRSASLNARRSASCNSLAMIGPALAIRFSLLFFWLDGEHEGELTLAGQGLDLAHLHLCYLVRVYASHPDAILVHVQHD